MAFGRPHLWTAEGNLSYVNKKECISMKIKSLLAAFLCCVLITTVLPHRVTRAATNFNTTSGSALIEAENTNYTSAGITNLYKGMVKESSSSVSGGAYLRPHSYSPSSSSPSGSLMNFTVNVDKNGRYTLWVRSTANSGEEGFWFKYGSTGYERVTIANSNSYGWKKLLSGYYLSAGDSLSFYFYPKESGNSIDCFLFTCESSYVPNGVLSGASDVVGQTMPLTYGIPSITPPNEHPRLMFRSSDINTIVSNASTSQNTAAKAYLDSIIIQDVDGLLPVSSGEDNYSNVMLNTIEAYALNYAVFGGNTGTKAVNSMLNYLRTVCFNPKTQDITRQMGTTIFRAAEVYDWCYNLLTPAQKEEIISCCEGIAAGMETSYPVTKKGNVTGHGSEFGLFRDMLALGIAVYNERPDIYNHVMGRIENEMVAARDFYYQSNSGWQGTSYSMFRYHAEIYAELMVRRMTGGQGLFSDDFEQVPYSWLYMHRPDGKFYSIGDDASIGWNPYNALSAWPSFMAGNLFGSAKIKGEFKKGRGTVTQNSFAGTYYTNYKAFNSVLWLLLNDPNVSFDTGRTDMPRSRYFASPNGMIIANSKWDYNTTNPSLSTAASALMKIGEVYGGNHDHLDAGSFQLYYKGILASGSGTYSHYGDSHDKNYFKRTIASNTLTIYNSSESFGGMNPDSNDGGQLWNQSEIPTFESWRNGSFDRGEVLDHAIAEDNSYSYIRGDITKAYSSAKASNVQRAMAFISTDDSNISAFMAVYDKMSSVNASLKKTFILHSQTEPSISGKTATVVNTGAAYNGTGNYGGKMTVNSLLPQNASITKVGGSSAAYSVNGTNYPASSVDQHSEPGWGRIEISPASSNINDDFLTIMTVSDADNQTVVTPELISGASLTGAKVQNKVVLFSNETNTEKNRVQQQASFSVSSSSTLDYMVFGLKSGQWIVKKDGNIVCTEFVTAKEATLSFSESGGNFTLEYIISAEYPMQQYKFGMINRVTSNNATVTFNTNLTSAYVEQSASASSAARMMYLSNNVYDTTDALMHYHFELDASEMTGRTQFRVNINNSSGGNNNSVIMDMYADDNNVVASVGSNAVTVGTLGDSPEFDVVVDTSENMIYIFINGEYAGCATANNDLTGNQINSVSLFTGNTVGNGTNKFTIRNYSEKLYSTIVEFDDICAAIAYYVPVEGITLDKTELTMGVGKTEMITSSILPATATTKYVTWSSSDNNIATVEDRTITAVAAGNVIITATTVEGGYSVSCFVRVRDGSPPEVQSENFGMINNVVTTNAAVTFNEDLTSAYVEQKSGASAARMMTLSNRSYNTSGALMHYHFDIEASEMTGRTQFRINANDASGGTNNVEVLNFYGDGESLSGIYGSTGSEIVKIGDRELEGNIKFDIIIDTATDTIYVFIDGEYEGSAVSIRDLSGNKINYTSIYAGNTAGNGTNKFTISNYSEKLYSTTVDFEDAYYAITYFVPVEGVNLNTNEITLKVGETEEITAMISPNTATETRIIWHTSDPGIASVANGVVTALTEGTATITVKTLDGGYSRSCTVTVIPALSVVLNTIVRNGDNYVIVGNAAGVADINLTIAIIDNNRLVGCVTQPFVQGEFETNIKTENFNEDTAIIKVFVIDLKTMIPYAKTKVYKATSILEK